MVRKYLMMDKRDDHVIKLFNKIWYEKQSHNRAEKRSEHLQILLNICVCLLRVWVIIMNVSN